MKKLGGQDLLGHYQFDDEGVPAAERRAGGSRHPQEF